ncbi:MAG: hypothetical protein XD95_0698 [Microgenomates bacterium 39_7]|nr:MAG: hypothetical protein XD95_0698 [Microgenomates bacterium 39_7]
MSDKESESGQIDHRQLEAQLKQYRYLENRLAQLEQDLESCTDEVKRRDYMNRIDKLKKKLIVFGFELLVKDKLSKM